MTRKDYTRIADAIGWSMMVATANMTRGIPSDARDVIDALGAAFAADNPNYDHARFMARVVDVASGRVSVDRPAYDAIGV